LRAGFSSAAGTARFAGFSRASIAVESRETWPTSRSFCVAAITASCTFVGNWLAANSANAREKVEALGTAPARL
jgi:hypothetical protein